MSTDNSEVFTKDNLDLYFKELSKEYKRLGGSKASVLDQLAALKKQQDGH